MGRSQRKPILRKIGQSIEKTHLRKNCIVNYPCDRWKGKHNITIWEDPRKHDPNIKKDSNPAPAIPDS